MEFNQIYVDIWKIFGDNIPELSPDTSFQWHICYIGRCYNNSQFWGTNAFLPCK